MVITPLITTPYISRVLGSSEIGKYSFVASTVSVFIVISNLGFHQYSQRKIASLQKMKKAKFSILGSLYNEIYRIIYNVNYLWGFSLIYD